MKTFLILGVNGMAGHMIAQYLKEQGHKVYGFARQESPVCETLIGDATNKEDVRQALQAHIYDYVVNAIGVLNRFVDEHPADGVIRKRISQMQVLIMADPKRLEKCVTIRILRFAHRSSDRN